MSKSNLGTKVFYLATLRSWSIIEGSQGRNLRQGPNRSYGGILLIGLLSQSRNRYFLYHPGPAAHGWHFNQWVGWPQTNRDSLGSVSQVLGLSTYASTPAMTLIFSMITDQVHISIVHLLCLLFPLTFSSDILHFLMFIHN